ALPGRGFPRINDITTDTTNPPAFVALAQRPEQQGRDLNYPGESFASQQQSGYPDLEPLIVPAPPEEVFQRAQKAARHMPQWQVIHADPVERTIEGTATSRLFRFKDDFVIQVRPAPDGNGSAVHMRSKSRDGRGDIGANAARIRAFFAKLS
ncbi:MAG TPA: DUF1499 domain-containing protein, partial [Terriglobales bacterium]|nr:DUF1499 domain-containing protein [Terriglobales bacterium]